MHQRVRIRDVDATCQRRNGADRGEIARREEPRRFVPGPSRQRAFEFDLLRMGAAQQSRTAAARASGGASAPATRGSHAKPR